MSYSPKLQALLDSLNQYQIAAVNVGPGLACVSGVPGSGKSRVITARIARMADDGLDPQYVLAMTFTRSAAEVMNSRLKTLGIESARVGTIHSVCRQIVAAETDLMSHGTVDEKDKLKLETKKLLAEYRKNRSLPQWGVDLEGVLRYIDDCKATGLCHVSGDPFLLNDIADQHLLSRAQLWSQTAGVSPKLLVNLFVDLERKRDGMNLYSFDDMLLWSWMKLISDPEARLRWRQRWAVVIVDESQDSHPIQWDVARLLVGLDSCISCVKTLSTAPVTDNGLHNLMVAGDASQCHPPGTLVLGGRLLPTPIEDLTEESIVMGWSQASRCCAQPRFMRISRRGYRGRLLSVHAADRIVRVTPNHKFITMDASSGELVELLADELVPQQTFVPLPEGANNWTPVTGVEWEWYVGPVYSLDVEYDHAYVADGIVVLNSIYKWRSAEPTLFVDFSKNPDVQSLVLPLNYRSNQTICSVSTGIVRGKPWHIAGDIISTRQILHPDAIKIKEYETVEMEAEDVVRQCRELGVENGLRSSVVLSRLKVGLDLVEIACIRQRVPYIKMASGSFFESKEVRDILGYLRVAANYDPDGSWMRHIINKPFRFIGLPTIAKATAMAEARNMALLDCLCEVSDELHFRQRKAVRELAQLLQDMNALSVKADAHELAVSQATPMPVANPLEYTSAPEKMIGMVLDRTGYVEELRREEGLLGMDESRVAALAALKRMASLFSTAAPFLAYVDALTVAVQEAKRAGLRLKEGTTKDALTLSTIHRIKGMEANNIFLVDVAQGRFPCAKSTDPDEELRLLYVAVTRAADFCQVSYASGSNGIKSSHISLLERELKMVVRT